VAEAGGRAKVTTASAEAAAIQSFANVLGFNKVLAPTFIFIAVHRLTSIEVAKTSNNEFFFIGFCQSCFARGLAIFSIGTTVTSRKRFSFARG
jgi:hypothetical protein